MVIYWTLRNLEEDGRRFLLLQRRGSWRKRPLASWLRWLMRETHPGNLSFVAFLPVAADATTQRSPATAASSPRQKLVSIEPELFISHTGAARN